MEHYAAVGGVILLVLFSPMIALVAGKLARSPHPAQRAWGRAVGFAMLFLIGSIGVNGGILALTFFEALVPVAGVLMVAGTAAVAFAAYGIVYRTGADAPDREDA